MKKLGLVDKIEKQLAKNEISVVLFSDVEPDPPIEEVEKAGKVYQDEGCDGLIAVGGGSSMDAAKAVGAAVAKQAMDKGIKQVAFDRSGFRFHGRIKALADAAREAGLEF